MPFKSVESDLSLFGERLSIQSASVNTSRTSLSTIARAQSVKRKCIPKVKASIPKKKALMVTSAPLIVVKPTTASALKVSISKPKIRVKKIVVCTPMDTQFKDVIHDKELNERLKRRAQLVMMNRLLAKLEDAKLVENQSV
jgi:hypothetical protein